MTNASTGWLALLLVSGFPFQAAAQRDTLSSGRWRGAITPEGDVPYRVSWLVSNGKRGSQIELRMVNGPTTVMGGVRLKRGRLTFTWAAGGPRPFFCRKTSSASSSRCSKGGPQAESIRV